MTARYTVTVDGPNQRTVTFRPWPTVKQIRRVGPLLRRRRRGYVNPLPIDGRAYRRRTRRRKP